MFDIFIEKLKNIVTSRLLPIAFVFIALFGVLVSRIFTLQIVQGEEHDEEITLKYVKTREIKSTRGNIYDKKGVLLAHNELTYSVVLGESPELVSNKQKNDMLYKLIMILEEHGNTIESEFGISLDEDGNLIFNVEGTAELRFKKNAYGKRYTSDLNEEQIAATAGQVFDFLRFGDKSTAMFQISDEYSTIDALKIMKLRYSMFTNYPKYNQIIISSDVDEVTVAAIYENIADLPGVDILQSTNRVYEDSIYTAHILGYTGLINAAELESKEGTDYNSSDVIGKSGIEKEFEDYLAGKKGLETISITESGKFLRVDDKTDPVAGNDIYLTIDSELQKAIYKIVERHLAGILITKINNSTSAGTRGVSSKDIKIPIYDVYYALINNNIIDINAFLQADATKLEKEVYQKFLTEKEDVFNQLDTLLDLNSTTTNSEASIDMQVYLNYIYEILNQKAILLKDQIDKSDGKYIAYQNNKLSLSKFLQHAIASNWIDLNKLDIDDPYFITEEVYDKLLNYIKDILINDSDFHKKIYYDLVYTYKLTGTEICLLLFDQGVIKYNEGDITKLENGTISAYSFLINKIENIEITPAQLALEPSTASVVVVDNKTGDVVAMVSYPSYDNNKLANKIDADYFYKLNNDLTLPQIHRAAKQRTAPGSTYKMVSAIAGLEEGVIGLTETIEDQKTFDKIYPAPSCWSSRGHGLVDVQKALEVSCNYFFYELGYRLGTDSMGKYKPNIGLERIAKYASILGLDKNTGIEVEEKEPAISNKDAVRSAIGQGNNEFTPVQLARYTATIANSGKLFDLTLIDKIVDKDGDVVLENEAKSRQLTEIKETTWKAVQEGMFKVANGEDSSSLKIFKNLPVEVAGKTGTAQISVSNANHALFVSYAPYVNPEISTAVVIPNGYASSNAVELARDVYSYYFKLGNYEQLVNGLAIHPNSESAAFSD